MPQRHNLWDKKSTLEQELTRCDRQAHQVPANGAAVHCWRRNGVEGGTHVAQGKPDGVTMELPGGDVVEGPARRILRAPTPAEPTSRR
jgi:hypothetical protein